MIVNLGVIGIIYGIRCTLLQFLKWFVPEILGIPTTPDFFKDYGTGSFNGALWSVMVELQFYILTGFFYKKIKKWHMLPWLLLLFGTLAVDAFRIIAIDHGVENMAIKLLERSFLHYLSPFLAGMFCFVFREQVLPILRRHYFSIMAGYMAICFLVESTSVRKVLACVAVPCIVIGLAYRLGKIRMRYTLSYPIYLFHMVVMNIFIYYSVPLNVLSVLLQIIIVLMLAAFSEMIFDKGVKHICLP